MILFETQAQRQALPLFTDVAWDAERGAPRFEGGEPVIVSGIEAVKGWAARAIATERYRWEIFSRSYGCELRSLVGQPYRADTKLSEAVRYVTDALTISPYITACSVTDAVYDNEGKFTLTVDISTVYGKERLYV